MGYRQSLRILIPTFVMAVGVMALLIATAISRRRTTLMETHNRSLSARVETLEARHLLSGAPGILDEVPGAHAAFALRQLSAHYAGPAIEVRRSSDDATQTLGFAPDGTLDLTALDTFAGTSDVFVVTWFDQSTIGANLSQTDPDLQPQIVDAGAIIRDAGGVPAIHFQADVLTTTTSALISNQDLTAFFVQEAEPHPDERNTLLGLGDENHYNHLLFYLHQERGGVLVGDGSSAQHLGDIRRTLQSSWKTIQVLDSVDDRLSLYRNVALVDEKTHTSAASEQASFSVGDYSGLLSEVVLYPHLTDLQRQSVYADLNGVHRTGPETQNEAALLPQDWQYQVEIYDWLETLTLPEVTLSPAQLTWDGTFTDVDQLANVWLATQGGASEYSDRSATEILRANPGWFVLDDGAGHGIEATGAVRNFQSASMTAFWHSLSLPLATGAEGNPYHQDPALALRGLVSAAVDMVMTDELQDSSPQYWSNVDFAGGALNGWVKAYEQGQHLLDATTRDAFQEGFRYMAWKLLQWGAHDINGNIDVKAIAALAHISNFADDPATKEVTVRAARKILFGSEVGTPETTDYQRGLFRKAGYIDEGDSPDTTYNGVSLFYMLEAVHATKGDPAWSFLETVSESMLDFKLHQYFTDPDGYVDGPSGYAGRTGNSYVFDQRDKLWRDLTAAAYFDLARPLTYSAKFRRPHLLDTEAMVSAVNQSLATYNARDIGSAVDSQAPVWRENHWPVDNFYRPDSGWYTALKTLFDADDASTRYPFDRPHDFSKTFDEEFWAYKGSDNTGREFGFFAETLRDAGNYSGWYGGSLQTFWTRDTGTVILARHDNSGGDPTKQENTRDWSQIDRWATHHVWGRDEAGSAFSIAATENLPHPVEYDLETPEPIASVATLLGGHSTKGQATGTELTGQVTFTNQFRALQNGLEITHRIASDQIDAVKELWVTLPVFLRDSDQPNIADATIEYWDGSTWNAATTTIVETEKVRIGRDFGQGNNYAYVLFQQPRRIKLSEQVWVQSYQGNSRIRNLHVDLHGNPGTERLLEANIELKFTISAALSVDTSVEVVGRYLFYNDSFFDDGSAANEADDHAIATDKVALVAGTATFRNYSGYSKGINGIMVDVAGLTGTLNLSDFKFHTWDGMSQAGWAAVANPTLTVRLGEGVSNSDRATLIWANGQITNTWLRVTVDTTIGLAEDDVFYFGNLMGDTGNSSTWALADLADIQSTFSLLSTSANDIESRLDNDRDGFVTLGDFQVIFGNLYRSIALISIPSSSGAARRMQRADLNEGKRSAIDHVFDQAHRLNVEFRLPSRYSYRTVTSE